MNDKNNAFKDAFGCSYDYETQEIKNFASWILSLSPLEFTTLGTVIGYILSCTLTVQEQNSLGNWLELVGQILLTFNAQGSSQLPPSPAQYCHLVDKVKSLERELDNLKKQNNP